MQNWITGLFNTSDWGVLLFMSALFLGVIGAISSCCNLPAIGAIAGYAGSKQNKSKNDLIQTSIGFVIGALSASILLGIVIGYSYQTIAQYLEGISKFIAGMTFVFMGLISLELFPVKLPEINFSRVSTRNRFCPGRFIHSMRSDMRQPSATTCNWACHCGW